MLRRGCANRQELTVKCCRQRRCRAVEVWVERVTDAAGIDDE